MSDTYKYDKIEALRRACGSDSRLSYRDIVFGKSLCDQYFSRLFLSDKQWYWVGELLKRAGEMPSSAPEETSVEEIFSGQQIRALFIEAAKTLKFPKLRYQTDGGSKIVFSYAKEGKWAGSTFIDNGGKAEGKKRYGFISSLGNGKLDHNAPPDIKTAIRKIADDPVGQAKLHGQKYSYCCFCGLELVNKSSVYHGYGPICAEKYGLPWGDTGDQEDQEAAAVAELKHVQLHDLE